MTRVRLSSKNRAKANSTEHSSTNSKRSAKVFCSHFVSFSLSLWLVSIFPSFSTSFYALFCALPFLFPVSLFTAFEASGGQTKLQSANLNTQVPQSGCLCGDSFIQVDSIKVVDTKADSLTFPIFPKKLSLF